MKTLRSLTSVIALVLATGLVATLVGCSSTATRRSTGEFVDDAGITTKVKTALFKDPIVSGFDVGINTFRGHVQLNGYVDTPEQKARAGEIARSVQGVTSVGNQLAVKTEVGNAPAGMATSGAQMNPQSGPNDGMQYGQPAPTGRDTMSSSGNVDPLLESAARAVRQRWDANPELARQNLRVWAEGNRLVFDGTVQTADLWERAKDSAESVTRGIAIENRIRVNEPAR